jgi:hypothetical protein
MTGWTRIAGLFLGRIRDAHDVWLAADPDQRRDPAGSGNWYFPGFVGCDDDSASLRFREGRDHWTALVQVVDVLEVGDMWRNLAVKVL